MPLACGLVGAALVLWVSWPAAGRELPLDDAVHLGVYGQQNSGLPLWRIAALPHWQSQAEDSLWRPIPKILWAQLGSLERTGLGAWAVTGVLAGLVCLALASIFHRAAPQAAPRWPLAAIAILPVVHGLSADVVLPFVGQADLLAAVFLLGAVRSLLARRPRLRWLAAPFLFAAFLCKESTFPAVFFLPVAVMLREDKPSWREVAAVAAASVVLLASRFALQVLVLGAWQAPAGAAGSRFVGGERSVSFFELAGRYAAGIVFPVSAPQTDYSFLKQPGSEAGLWPFAGVLALIVWAAVAGSAFRSWAKRGNRAAGLTATGAVGMALFLGPYAGVLPMGAIWAGRFVFLSLICFSMVLAGASIWVGDRRFKWSICSYATLLALWGGFLVAARAPDWKGPEELWTAEVQREPNHAFAWKNRAALYQESGDVTLALEAIRRSVELWPSFGEGHLAHGQIARGAGRPAEAEAAFARAAALLPADFVPLLRERALFLASRGNFEEAQIVLQAWIEVEPESERAAELLRRVERDREAGRP
ncbi:MAG: tetratricopeptide repeat protein [Sumerlaeia bacterium]